MAFSEDFDAYRREFGVDATLNGAPVRILFDNAYDEFSGVSTRQASASLPTAEAEALGAEQDAPLVILPPADGAGSYLVRVHKPDGTGWSVLALERQ